MSYDPDEDDEQDEEREPESLEDREARIEAGRADQAYDSWNQSDRPL